MSDTSERRFPSGDGSAPDLPALRDAISSGDPVQAMPALAGLRVLEAETAVPLLLLGLRQEPFVVRSLSAAGLGVKRNEEGWQALVATLTADPDPNVRAEAANALASYGADRAWPLLREAFARDDQWLVRCSILSALAEEQEVDPTALLELAGMALADGDGTVRVGGAEILGRLVREGDLEARAELSGLQNDPDHRVVAAALNGLQI
jgi:HEAT repeat protein